MKYMLIIVSNRLLRAASRFNGSSDETGKAQNQIFQIRLNILF